MLNKVMIIALGTLMLGNSNANGMSYFRRLSAPLNAGIAMYTAKYWNTRPVACEKIEDKGPVDGLKAHQPFHVLMDFRYRRNLSHADLRYADLNRTNLFKAKLDGAKLDGAELRWAKLHDATLTHASLRTTDLRFADLSGANLYDANLSYAEFNGANLYNADLSRANLYNANLYDAILSCANLYGANLCDADFCGAILVGAKFKRAKFQDARNLHRAEYKKCSWNFWSGEVNKDDQTSEELAKLLSAGITVCQNKLLVDHNLIN